MVGAILKEPMKVQARAGVSKIISHAQRKMVADGGCDEREWPLSIDANRWPIEGSVGIGRDPLDCEDLNDGFRLDERG